MKISSSAISVFPVICESVVARFSLRVVLTVELGGQLSQLFNHLSCLVSQGRQLLLPMRIGCLLRVNCLPLRERDIFVDTLPIYVGKGRWNAKSAIDLVLPCLLDLHHRLLHKRRDADRISGCYCSSNRR